MENSIFHLPPSSLFSSLSSFPKPYLKFIPSCPKRFIGDSCLCLGRRSMRVTASAGPSHCEFSSLNSPLEPRSQVGKYLSGVLQNHRQLFHVVAKEEMKLLSDERDDAVARMIVSHGSDEGVLHRRIAEIKEKECQIAVEDVMYLKILYKFSEIRVHLVPKLSSCLYNGRLEILPSKDWELESIHSLEVLDVIREHISTITGLRSNASVSERWATTKIRRFWLARIYVASIFYGYFLKSVSLRYHLERSLLLADGDGHKTPLHFHDMCSYGSEDVIIGHKGVNMQSIWQEILREGEEIEDLKCYIMGFRPGSLQRFATLRSKEGLHLVKSHSHALFGNKDFGLMEHDDVIWTSFSSLRRLILEAVAFGSFLWESEECVDDVYKLKDHEVV